MSAVARQGGYMFHQEPHAVNNRQKYRDPSMTMTDGDRQNIMHDRRVVRGNTYAAQVPTMSQIRAAEQTAAEYRRKARQATLRRERAARSRGRSRGTTRGSTNYNNNDSGIIMANRRHMTVQTDDYLQELDDKVFEAEKDTQTEYYDDGEVPPLFAPKPAGRSVGTMIEPGELFDFDLGVEPILEVLVGKCLDQGLNEVLEEEELKLLQRHKLAFEHKRNAELAEVQRLEAASQRRFEEKERRLKQQRDRLMREQAVAQKVAASTTAKEYLAGLSNSILHRLERSGHFYDPVSRQVEAYFLPWLEQAVVGRLDDVHNARGEVDGVLGAAISSVYQRLQDEQDRLAEVEAEKEREAQRKEGEKERLQRAIAEEEENERRRWAAQEEAERRAELERERLAHLEEMDEDEDFDEDGRFMDEQDRDGFVDDDDDDDY